MSRMEGSAGELQKAYDEYMKSAEAHINQFKAAFEELAMSFVKSDFITEIVDIGRELVELLSKFTALINTLGGLKTVLIGVGAALIGMKFSAIIGWVTKMASGFGALIKMLHAARLGITAVGVSAESAAVAMSILKTAAVGLVVGGIMLLVNYINKQKEAREAEQRAAEEAVRASKESLANNTERIKSLIDLRNEYLNIVDGEDSYAKKTQELNKWKQTLIETYGLEKDAIDKVNLSRETGLGLMDEEIGKDIDTAIAEATAAYNDALNKISIGGLAIKTYDRDIAGQISNILHMYYGKIPDIDDQEPLFGEEYYVRL